MIGSEPAFPVGDGAWEMGTEGLSKREYFAAQAMVGLAPTASVLPNYMATKSGEVQKAFLQSRQMEYALVAVELADALMVALNRKETTDASSRP